MSSGMCEETFAIILLGKLELRPGDTRDGEDTGVAPESNVDRAVGVRGWNMSMLLTVDQEGRRLLLRKMSGRKDPSTAPMTERRKRTGL